MKITIEPTDGGYLGIATEHPTISIQYSSDDLDIWDVWEKLIEPALLAWGFQSGNINDLINPSDETAS